MIDDKKVEERIKELEEELAKIATMEISMRGGVIELKKLLPNKKGNKKPL